MLPLYEDPCFTFRFADDRIIPRFHLEGVEAGRCLGLPDRPTHQRAPGYAGDGHRWPRRVGRPPSADQRASRQRIRCSAGNSFPVIGTPLAG